jgi:hypothetical protein
LRAGCLKATVFVPLFLAAACGDIHSTGNLGDPLVILDARVEGKLPDNISALLLRASLIWETQSKELLECLDRAGTEEEVYACTTPEDFRPVQASRSVPIEPTFPASFEVPLYLLPDLAMLSGERSSLLGYGVLVVYEDGNRNMKLDLVPPGALESQDTILASGIPTDENRRDLVVYREGKLSPLWKLFQHPPYGCPEPPQGFSVLTREYHASEGFSCTVVPASAATIPVHFEDSEDLRQLICEPQFDIDTYPSEPPPPDREVTCHFHDTLEYVMDPSWYCQYRQVYQLAGCHAYFGCQEPDWDLTDNPPAWWPCTGESDNGFSISDHPDDLTPYADELFLISYDSGAKKFAVNEIEVWLLLTRTEGLVFTHPRSIMLIDHDGDSLFSKGDVLEMFEPVLTSQFDEAQRGVKYKVILQHSPQPLEPVETLAELTWSSPAQ